ncbi:MAG: adenylate/guanylate cyclase domain-containing protein [Rhodospirillales bacterium]
MGEKPIQRRLAAIVATDMVGYSRLMEADEEGTLARQKVHRTELFDPKIAEHHGRIVKTMGDGLLVEFPSVVDAVKCAVEVQQAMAGRDADVLEERRIHYRIGINLGDIVIDGDDILGDGVNIAARLEGLAKPGGICISGNVHEQVSSKTNIGFEDAGEKKVKNIARSVRVWHWEADRVGHRSRHFDEQLPLPEKPSIAVLPFVNMSDDPEQEYFADGITEDIVTELSRFQGLFVIARNSVFCYKGKTVTVSEVGRELGVHYVVEGSVRRAKNRVRVTSQLVNTETESHVWAERYDRELTDIFDLQDEVAQAIVGSVASRLESADIERVKRKHAENMAAYDYVLRGKMHHHCGTKEDNAEALRLLDKAIELEPDFADAYAWKACTLGQAIARSFGEDTKDLLERDLESAQKGLSLDKNNIECHRIMCELHMMWSQLDQAEPHHEKAFALNPNDARIVAQRGELMTWLGKPDEGVDWVRTAMRLDPYGADAYLHLFGRALHAARRYADAFNAFMRIPNPSYGHHADMAACCAQIGNDKDAEIHAAGVLRVKPDFSITDYLENLPYKQLDDREHHGDGLRKANLPE